MMGMTEFVWRLHGGLKGYSRAVLRDWAVWLIAGVLLWEYFNPFPVGGNPLVFKARRYEHYLWPSAESLSAAPGGT
ncbi:MAG: hypothetical protein IH921_10990, partial [Gemmatimonadetes bacterium]|nr:hypothetical protein [Gemmatimonadota bacterium]